MQAEDADMKWISMNVKASLASAKGYWLDAGLSEDSWETYQCDIMCSPHNKTSEHTTAVSLSRCARDFPHPDSETISFCLNIK